MNDHADRTTTHMEPSDAGVLPAPEGVLRTGNDVVDEVLSSLDGLEKSPVSTHVSVFEAAHERLRGALADAGDDRT